MNATERHATLIDAGWRVRLDGRMYPPGWGDTRAYTAAAAWQAHLAQIPDRSDRPR